MRKQITSHENAVVGGPFSQAIETDNLVLISGQIGMNKEGVLESGIEEQTRMAFINALNICKEANVDLHNAIKVTVLVSDLNNMPIVNNIYKEYFKEPYPTRMGYEVSRLPKDSLIEMDFIIQK